MSHSAQEAWSQEFHFEKCSLIDILSFRNPNPQGIEE